MPSHNLRISTLSIQLLFLLIFTLANFVAANDKFHFKEHPVNQSMLIGSDLLLKCSISQPHASSSQFHIQWRTNKGIILSHQHGHEIPGYSGRYSYVKETPEELHLKIANVTLEDDGTFQCQVLKKGGKFLRANAHIDVLVPPSSVHFQNYQSGGTIVVNEGIQLNITCMAAQSKPAAELNLFLNGKKAVESDVHRGTFEWANGTVNTFASLALRPGKMHHNKVISCEGNHPETGTKLRDSITLDVYYSSDRPKIDLIGAESDRPLKANQNITLLCTAEGGNPPPQLLWSNQNGPISDNYSFDAANQLTQNAYSFMVTGTDNGIIYECMSQTHQNMTPLISRVTLHVDYPPANVLIFGSTVVRKGESLTMSCASSVSSPASVITWNINGSPTKVQPQDQKKQMQGFTTESNITIDSNTLSHGQNQMAVECVASNGEGTPVSKSHIIRVLSPPSHPIIVESEPNTVPLEGTLYNLSCEAQGGHPFATLSWFRGIEKNAGKHSTVSSDTHQLHKKKIKWKQLKETENSLNGDSSRSTLTLLLDRSMNHQQIRCEAENGATDLPLVAKKNLVVLFPPTHVRVQPTRNVHMIAGTPTELSCVVPSSNPVAELIWEFPNSVNKQLTITRTGEQVRRSNKPVGEYHGYESENVIQFTPNESMDKSENFLKGHRMSLSSPAVNSTASMPTEPKGREQIQPISSSPRTLKVRCVASHHLWSEVKYGSYLLDIKYPPRIAVEGQMSVVVGEGQSFEENITIHANPRVNAFAWRKNGITIDRSVGNIFTRQSIIGGIGVAKEDSGIYTLFVSNGVGTANATIRLVVEYSARVTYITSPVIASVGEDVVLECEAEGMPMKAGMIKWLRGQEEVKSLVQDQRRAVIRMNASHENSGAYTCLVDNGIGQPNQTTAYLLVRRAPEVIKRPGFNRAAGPIGGKATLRCRASAVPNAEFTWGIEGEGHMIHHNTTKYRFFDTQLDHTTFQSTLTILSLEERDYTRRYRCRVSNRLGIAQTFISVGPPTPPEQPTELEIVNITNSSASISWMPGFDGGSDQMFELIYQDMDENNHLHSVNTTESQINLRNLKIKHGYSVQIRAINARGDISDLTQPLLFRTLDENHQEAQGGLGSMISKDSPLGQSTIVALCIGFLALVLLNCCLICYLNRRNKRRREKNCLTQNGSSTASSSGRTIQIYGAMIALQQQQQQPRPGSTPTTNRSELMVPMQGGNGAENGMMMDDNQSTRTIIEVSPYGHFNGGNAMMGNDFFYNANCIAEFETIEPTTDYYAKIQKGANHSNGMGMNNNYNGNANIMNYSMGPGIDANLSYQAVPNPEPPYAQPNGSGIVLYSSEQLNPMEMASAGIPPSPYMETRSACFVPSPTATGQMSSGYLVESGSLQRAPKMLTTFQNGENGIGASGISIRDTYQGDLV